MPKVLITGISGQDGSYLAELLLNQGYEVHGLVRRAALEEPHKKLWRIFPIINDITLHTGSLESHTGLFEVVRNVEPDYIYHLGAMSFVSYEFEDEYHTLTTNLGSTHTLLSAVQKFIPECKFYFAASSEMFGLSQTAPQSEETPFNPRSVYGISKLAGFHLCKAFRENKGLYTSSGILFNHESPRRGGEYVTQKIVSQAVAIKRGQVKELRLGNLDAKRDWGHAKDYVIAMQKMTELEKADDFVISSGITHSVREFCQKAFACLDLNYRDYVVSDPLFFRPSEKIPLCGDNSKAKKILGWVPTHSFNSIIEEMIEFELKK
ncbi:MAG: GDP-mannose 4,6-dehydratase [Verrucomicrobiia bacterium]